MKFAGGSLTDTKHVLLLVLILRIYIPNTRPLAIFHFECSVLPLKVAAAVDWGFFPPALKCTESYSQVYQVILTGISCKLHVSHVSVNTPEIISDKIGNAQTNIECFPDL